MGQQIIRQPDGQFALFSSETDTIIMWDATAEDIMDHFIEVEVHRTRQLVERLLGHVAAGEPRKAYYQFAMTWDEALASDEEHGGEAWEQVRSAEASAD